MEPKTKKQRVLDCISDRVSDLLYYHRKEDEELPIGEIDRMVRDGEITVDEMVAEFRSELEKGLQS